MWDTITTDVILLKTVLYRAHRGVIPGLAEFVAEYTSERAIGEEGYLIDRGLIPLPEDLRERIQREAAESIHLSRFGS